MAIRRSPRLLILLEIPGSDELAEVTVQTDNRDMVRWDRARVVKKWPELGEAPVLWMTFLAWAAIRRIGSDVHTGDYDSFEARAVEVHSVDEDGNPITKATANAGDELDPTQ